MRALVRAQESKQPSRAPRHHRLGSCSTCKPLIQSAPADLWNSSRHEQFADLDREFDLQQANRKGKLSRDPNEAADKGDARSEKLSDVNRLKIDSNGMY